VDLRLPLKPMVPEDDQATVLPWASVMVTMVLLKLASTCAVPEVMFLRSFLRVRAGVAGLAIGASILECGPGLRALIAGWARRAAPHLVTFFLPAIGTALPLRVRALVWVRWPRTGRPLRWRRPR
jgi:hypothetical protein